MFSRKIQGAISAHSFFCLLFLQLTLPKVSFGCSDVFGAKHNEASSELIKVFTGRVDVLDAQVFLVTLKVDGEPVQFRFDVALAKEAGLREGNFVSLFRAYPNSLRLKFAKIEPKLSPEENREIDDLVDRFLDGLSDE